MKFIYSILFLSCCIANAQIVNIESLRRTNDSTTWSGHTTLSFDLTKNKNHIFSLFSKTQVQYLKNRNLVFFVNDIAFKEANQKKLISKGIQHLRYNYKITNRVIAESFVQSQYDEISAIDFRGLIGLGGRFVTYNKQGNTIFLGLLSMYEHEKIVQEQQNITENNFRNSTYISLNIFLKKNISLISTTYFQPLYRNFDDYRISNDTTLAITLFKNFDFTTRLTYLFDSTPALNVPKEQYRLSNGIAYTFN